MAVSLDKGFIDNKNNLMSCKGFLSEFGVGDKHNEDILRLADVNLQVGMQSSY